MQNIEYKIQNAERKKKIMPAMYIAQRAVSYRLINLTYKIHYISTHYYTPTSTISQTECTHVPTTPARMSRGNCSSPQALTSPTPSSSPPPPPPPPPPSLFCSILSLHLRTSELEQYRPRCPHASNLKIELTHLISYVLRISFTFFFFTGSISIHGHLKLRIDIFICEHKYLIYAIVEKL